MKYVYCLLVTLLLGACMYPGVDNQSLQPMGEALSSIQEQQTAYPHEHYDDAHIVEGIDGDVAKSAYDNLHNVTKGANKSNKVGNDIKINIAK